MHEFDCLEGDSIVCDTENGSVSITILETDASKEEIWLAIDVPPGFTISIDGEEIETWGNPTCSGLPKLWLMFSLILSGRTKREIFMPSFNEFVEDYLYAQNKFRGKWEQRWTRVAFTCRSLSIVFVCLRIQLWGSVLLVSRILWRKLFGE
ncbi:hypothetical protein [Rubinisphaera italica]|uniref:Uncharacterized protein n=1 Tax=Rubinisphaera italica TaxID=2527969 RepID=A0A5C5XNP0_9PLAN|nr:hypothetical protein [Rubinisphaera italica]TWT63382.1 hypothetical protein Pan54_41350 [Rubinisphaera italica]